MSALEPVAMTAASAEPQVSLFDVALPLVEHWKLLIGGSLLAGLVVLGYSFMIAPTFTSRTTVLSPQQQQQGLAAVVGQSAAIAGLAGLGGTKSPADQYVSLMQSSVVTDRLIERFKLMEVYKSEFRFLARKTLLDRTRIAVGKRDGIIAIEVDDKDPRRAADLANAFVEELRVLSDRLALSEAQQRRVFFEKHLQETRDRLAKAQQALGASGFSQGALKAEPRAAAENYARLRAELTAAEVKLQTLRQGLVESTPEVQQQQALVAAMRAQVGSLERNSSFSGDAEYVGRYREFKYQETLFELFSRQYELARVDESREGALIQVVDLAEPAEWKSKPSRALYGIAGTLVAFVLLAVFVVVRDVWRRASLSPETGAKIERLRSALRRR